MTLPEVNPPGRVDQLETALEPLRPPRQSDGGGEALGDLEGGVEDGQEEDGGEDLHVPPLKCGLGERAAGQNYIE